MYGDTFLENFKIVTAANYASGTATVNGATVDMSGYEGIVFIVHAATIAPGAVSSIKMQQGAAANLSDAADLLGTSISMAADDDDQIFAIELVRPLERYVRGVIVKDAANAWGGSAHYILYGSKLRPVSNNVADLVTSEIHESPIEGTA